MKLPKLRGLWKKVRSTLAGYRPYRYFFICLLLPIAILATFSAVYYCNYTLRTRADLQSEAQHRLSSASTFLDNTVKKIQVNSRLLINTESFYNLFYNMASKDDAPTVYDATKALVNYNATLDLVDSSFVYLRGQKTVLSGEGLTNADNFFTQSCIFSDYSAHYWATYEGASYSFAINTPTTIEHKPSTSASSITWHRVIPVLTDALTESKSQNLFVVCLNQDMVEKTLQSYRKSEDEVLVVADKKGTIIASTDTDKATAFLGNQTVQHRFLDAGSTGCLELSLQGKRYVVNSGASNFSYAHYRFLSFTPKTSFYSTMQSMNLFFITIILLTAAIFGALFYVFHSYILRPMKTLIGSIAHKGKEAGTGDANIVDFLADRVGDMQKDISTFVPILSEQHLVNLMTNPDAAARELPYGDNSVDSLPHAHFCVAVLQTQFSNAFRSAFTDEDRHKILKFLLQALKVQLSKGYVCHVINLQKNQIGIILNIADQFQAEQLVPELATVFGFFQYDSALISFSAGISRSCVELSRLHEAYQEARAALNTVPDGSPPERCVQIYSGSGDRVYFSFTTAQDNQLYYAVLQGHCAEAHAVLDTILKQNAARSLPHSESVKLWQYLFACILRAVKTGSLPLPWSKDFPDLSGEFDFADSGTTAQFLHELIDRTAQKADAHRQFSIDEVTDFIDTHYQDDLYLEAVAEKFGVTDKYLSRAFKESVHINFHDYLNRARMDAAKKLLVTTRKSVTEVGQAVGFNTHSTFFRVFKALEGVSPTDYRRLNRP
ncbi:MULTISPECIES: helix-turn-helix domain-containing protein [Caproicibacterium]|uniref:Helix-turn-helix domain-containing protein n=1 Tax=Caproicibacterium argilliputei TaxID=3030016 RepID=A0AA97D9B9_9FIRM|nr:helix-turn-helix domain-containing protein [Caproicibacterium argilliputei]WOC32636.1 helix-turn-helix domain-containing protein [Caproicibacterium argilliputei]